MKTKTIRMDSRSESLIVSAFLGFFLWKVLGWKTGELVSLSKYTQDGEFIEEIEVNDISDRLDFRSDQDIDCSKVVFLKTEQPIVWENFKWKCNWIYIIGRHNAQCRRYIEYMIVSSLTMILFEAALRAGLITLS